MTLQLVATSARKGSLQLEFSEDIKVAGGGDISPLYLKVFLNGKEIEVSRFEISLLNQRLLTIFIPDQLLESATDLQLSYQPPADSSDQGFIVDAQQQRLGAIPTRNVETLAIATKNSLVLSNAYRNLVLVGSLPLSAIGNSYNNTLTGNASKNLLNGMAGADVMAGGDGDDRYIVDNINDAVIEAPSQGFDIVESSVSFTLPADTETLVLTGTAATSGTGNSSANTIVGNDAGNTLDGGGGKDLLEGRWGDDTYIVDSSDDRILENGPTSDVDTVQSTVDWMLGDKLDILVLTGSSGLKGTGNKLNNTIVGNVGGNHLDGGIGGVDILTGLAGADVFYLSFRPLSLNAQTADRITDFSRLDGDKVAISRSSYKINSQSPSLVVASSESTLSSALRGSATFVYNNTSGELIWNENGSAKGHGRGGVICVFTNQPVIGGSDIFFV